jgi:predicted neuraminidase
MKRQTLLMAMGILLAASAWSAAAPQGELIFPLQDKHVHASSIVACPDGSLLATWFHGSGERWADDVQLQGARLKKGATEWSPVFVMADTLDMPDCNPVLFIDAQERLWLFWSRVVANRWEHALLKFRRAEDYLGDGPPKWSWQDIIPLKPDDTFPDAVAKGFKDGGFEQGCYGEYALPYHEMLVTAAKDKFMRQKGWMTRNHPTVLPSGRILLPLYSDGFNFSLMAISDDLGETWQCSGPLVGMGPTQPSLIQKKDGSIAAYLRDEGDAPQRVQLSHSTDNGETWTPAQDTEIPNPSASLEVIPLKSGRWIMIFNDTETDRHQIGVALSEDEGKTWLPKKVLDDEAGSSFSYPSMLQADDGVIHVSYSHRVKDGAAIKHVAFTEDWARGVE